ncbi:MAG: type II/IV secretion system protein [Bacteroidales bacterium]|nr:type II/IV secretion system protein [Bacteroidales bacterium]
MPDIVPNKIELTTEDIQTISSSQAWHYRVLPGKFNGNTQIIYSAKRDDYQSLAEELSVVIDRDVVIEYADESIISRGLARYYGRKAEGVTVIEGIKEDDFLLQLIDEAARVKCSDIHFEKYDSKCRVRMRIDGKLIERYIIEKNNYPTLINKIKILSNLDIAERRLPQAGRLSFGESNSKIDIRVSILPTLHGEKVVLRLLSNDASNISINNLGFSDEQITEYIQAVQKPNGIILISGPTGSGKTTTLYATLKLLNKESLNILTVEDPVEYTLEGINQVHVKESIGLTFAETLRTFLRQDPDIIMLGEIRDSETAQMAIRAALTGHLVLSTIHTNSAWGIVSRLKDMGVPAFLLTNTLNMAMAQRLVRVLCPHCKKEELFSSEFFPTGYNAPYIPKTHHTSVGCSHCYYTGYKGRKAVYEMLTIDSSMEKYIKNDNEDINRYFTENRKMRLSDAAFDLFCKGETSIEEVYPIMLDQTNNISR